MVPNRLGSISVNSMDAPLRFLELFQRLPGGGLRGRATPEFGPATLPDPFVAPTLLTELSVEQPHVTFVAARGATGKSIFAERVSAMKDVPLWRLNLDKGVSAHAFDAKLAAYLGADGAERFSQDADAFVIVDALDEARMRVSPVSWGEFIDSLVPYAERGHKFMFLGRERIVEDVWLHFDDAGISCAWYEISHFDRDQRVQYVNDRVTATPGSARAEGAAYEQARDATLSALAGTVDAELSDSFVGYAPVLDAVVVLLAQQNHAVVRNTFSDTVFAEDRVGVLVKILRDLLDREQEKAAPTVQELGLDLAQAYSGDEQMLWLAADLLGAREPELSWCPPERRIDYVKRVREFLRDHPFRTEEKWASPVFSAYVGARRFSDPHIRDGLQAIGRRTGLLFDFVTATGESMIDEWQFAALHSSMLAAEWHAVEAAVTIEPETVIDGLEVIDADLMLLEAAQTRLASFQLVLDEPGALRLFGPTSYLSVDFPGAVAVGVGTSLTLGPECFVRCHDLHVRSETVEIARRAKTKGELVDEPSVALEVSGRLTLDGTLVGNPAQDAFEIRVPDEQVLVFPWVAYKTELLSSSVETAPNERATRFLNMLMILMRRHGHAGRMAVFDKKLHGRQSIKQSEFAAVINELEALGIVSHEGDLIYLQPDWEQHRFSGKGRPGSPILEDKYDIWKPILERISARLS
jgi:hypothetical protein